GCGPLAVALLGNFQCDPELLWVLRNAMLGLEIADHLIESDAIRGQGKDGRALAWQRSDEILGGLWRRDLALPASTSTASTTVTTATLGLPRLRWGALALAYGLPARLLLR
ncbi:MAG: hypothetical protein LC808_20480, partial [Actinobacteria bacterium]|nr:hypothetical protein [Actinomycetota bacterium]